MIVVKIEMWPRGDESQMYELGRTYIYNAGGSRTSTKKADYEVRVCRKGKYDFTLHDLQSGTGFVRRGRVEGYPRLAYNIWRLILRALKAAFPEEK
jgi:hypothetical protein